MRGSLIVALQMFPDAERLKDPHGAAVFVTGPRGSEGGEGQGNGDGC